MTKGGNVQQQSQVCPITLESADEIEQAGRKVFRFKEGNVDRVYNAEALAKCMKSNGSLLNPLTRTNFAPQQVSRLLNTIGSNVKDMSSKNVSTLPAKSVDELPVNVGIYRVPLKQVVITLLRKLFDVSYTSDFKFPFKKITTSNNAIYTDFVTPLPPTWGTYFGLQCDKPLVDKIKEIRGFEVFYYMDKPQGVFYVHAPVKMVDGTTSHLGTAVKFNGDHTFTLEEVCFNNRSLDKMKLVRELPNMVSIVKDTTTKLYPAFEFAVQHSVGGGGGSGEKLKAAYKGRSYTIRTGKRGGRYIVVKDQKIYVK